MRRIAAIAVLAALFAFVPFARSDANDETLIDFENVGADVDDAPSGFTAVVTGNGDPKGWKVRQGTAPQNSTGGRNQLTRKSSDASENRAYLCIYDDLNAKDVDVTVFFTATGGTFEQSAGVAVRVQDAKNYYVLRANAKNGNVALLRVKNGNIETIADRSTAITLNKWQKLRLAVKGDSFEAFVDDVSLFTTKDAAIGDAGKVGLWTRSDSEARFDDLRIVSK